MNFLSIPYIKEIIIVVLVATGSYYYGKQQESHDWEIKAAVDKQKITDLENRAPLVTERIVTEYKDRIQYIDRYKVETVTEYVTVVDDSSCVINKGFVKLHNNAVNVTESTPDETDREDSKKKLSELAKIVSDNYATYNKTATQLIQLQKWVTDQKKEWDKTK